MPKVGMFMEIPHCYMPISSTVASLLYYESKENLFTCNVSYERSIMHLIVYNKQRRYWTLSDEQSIFKTIIMSELDFDFMNQCFDTDGYNILHNGKFFLQSRF